MDTIQNGNQSMTAELASCFRREAIVELLNKYAIFLIDRRLVENKDAAIQKIGEIVSLAMDRGEADKLVAEEVIRNLESYLPDSQMTKLKKNSAQLADRVIHTVAICDFSAGTLEENEEFKKLQEAHGNYKAILMSLTSKYSDAIVEFQRAFATSFSSLIDAQFIEEYIAPTLSDYRS